MNPSPYSRDDGRMVSAACIPGTLSDLIRKLQAMLPYEGARKLENSIVLNLK